MDHINFISIILGLVALIIALTNKVFHQKPSSYCQRIFDEHQERIVKIETRLDRADNTTGEIRTELALLAQGYENIKKALDSQEKLLENISTRITEFLAKNIKENI